MASTSFRAYLTHPDHLRFAEEFVSAMAETYSSVQVEFSSWIQATVAVRRVDVVHSAHLLSGGHHVQLIGGADVQ